MALVVDRADFLIDRICLLCGKWRDLFAAIGVGVTAYYTISIGHRSLSSLWTHLAGMVNFRRRLSKYGNKVVVIGSSDAVRNEILKLLAMQNFNIILVQEKANAPEVSAYFEYEYSIPIVVRCSSDICTEAGAKSFMDLLEKSGVRLLIDTTCCLSTSVPIEPSEENFRQLRKWFDQHLWMRMAVMYTKLYLARKKQSFAATVVYSANDQREALGSNMLLHWLARALPLPPNGIQEQYFFPWKLNCPSTGRDFMVNSRLTRQVEAADEGLVSSLCRFWIPKPKTYARHMMWSFGQAGVCTGYLPHTFLQWLSSFVAPDLSSFAYGRRSRGTASSDLGSISYQPNVLKED